MIHPNENLSTVVRCVVGGFAVCVRIVKWENEGGKEAKIGSASITPDPNNFLWLAHASVFAMRGGGRYLKFL